MYFKGIKACCAQAFATVLAIPSEVSQEQCLKRIPDLVRNRTLFKDLEVTTARPENTEENQPIINLKALTFVNTTVTSKKVKDFTSRLLFCLNLYDASGMI